MSLNLATILREGSRRSPDATAILAGEVRLDYRSLHEKSRRFASALSRLGVRRGGHVALMLGNVPAFPIAYFGAHYLGAPVVPLNTQLTAEEVAYHLNDSDAVALVAGEACLDRARAALARAESCTRLVIDTVIDEADADGGTGGPARSEAGGHPTLAALTGPGTAPEEPPDLADTRPDDTAVILYTSGTTGRPKGAELTHFNLFCNAEQISSLAPIDGATRALGALPLFHSFGQTVILNAVLRRGGAVVLMARFEARAALELMRRHSVSFFAGVPTMYLAMLRCEEFAGSLPDLAGCLSGGAPMPVEVLRAFETRFGVTIRESYGLSETSPVASANPPHLERRPGSIGVPIENVEFRLVDAAGEVIERPGAPGEIWIRGPNVMKGYYKRPEATAETIRSGWLKTGDVAVRDADGFYFIVDRVKDMILRAGYNVYPREIEEVLYAHPAVAEAAVVGIPDERVGEEVRAVIVPRPGARPAPEEIIAYCRERLAAFKCPRVVEFAESLPKGPTGKILKRALRG